MTADTVLDLFCGAAGGWSVGLGRAGYRTVAACEIDPWRRARFAAAHPGIALFDDIRELTRERMEDAIGFVPGVVVASPPCQDASQANTSGAGIDGERTGLFGEALRLVAEIRPIWCGFENVIGLRTRGLERVLGQLADLDYLVDEPVSMGADHVMPKDGPWHERRRVWIVGARADAYRDELWQQPGWGSGADGSRATELGSDAGGADAVCVGRLQAQWSTIGRRVGEEGRQSEERLERAGADPGGARPDADGNRQSRSPLDEEVGGGTDLGNLDAGGWRPWAEGAGGHLRVADGLSARDARRWISALGDAVVPVIPYLIGRSMRRVAA